MKHLDLFSGIGGFALAARNVGWQTIQFVEVDSWCQKVLAKNFPGVPIHDDIKTFEGRSCDIATAGFPCQPYSYSGKRQGERDDRALWDELLRVVERSGPRRFIGENVPGLLTLGIEKMLYDLESIGYECGVVDIPAGAVGAPHRRHRVWILADSAGLNVEKPQMVDPGKELSEPRGIANAAGIRSPGWETDQPRMARVDDGISDWVDRARGLGNAIVPQVAELIFKAISHRIPECPDRKAAKTG